MMLKVLVVDDDQDIANSLKEAFEGMRCSVEVAESGEQALERVRQSVPEVVFADLRMSGMDGVELVSRLHEFFPSVISVVMTAQGSVDTAIAAMKRGAFDYILKPLDLNQLEQLLGRIEKFKALAAENDRLRTQLDLLNAPSAVATRNPTMRKLLETAAKVAVRDATVLITGESGTGKTLLAKMIHDGSPRRDAPFAVVNCATLSENLLESELFGHVRGAFTGAVRDKIGRLQAADTGTAFLDEIGEIPASLQTKLLRFLQEREFERVGDTKTLKVDVRIIAATNKDLEKEVREGRFREDLYYRLNVIDLKMPALRERSDDLPGLMETLLDQACSSVWVKSKTLSKEARKVLETYQWPGNIRELKNALERAAILSTGEEITPDDLPDRVLDAVCRPAISYVPPVEGTVSLEELERIHIERIVATTKTLEEAATILGINVSTLWRKRKQYGMSELPSNEVSESSEASEISEEELPSEPAASA